MAAWLGPLVAGLIATTVSAWWYVGREERVRGRAVPAVLRGLALFLALSSPWAPSLERPASRLPDVAVLVDVSASMGLPAAGSGGGTRADRALTLAGEIADAGGTVWAFGSFARRATLAELGTPGILDFSSRLVPALDQARGAGADSIIVVTDGELDDREDARRLAIRYGVAVVERRVSETTDRAGIRSLSHPSSVAAGDTLDLRVDIVAAGEARGTLAVVASLSGSDVKRVEIDPPGAGKVAAASFVFLAPLDADTAEWRPIDVHLATPDGVWSEPSQRRTWVRILPRPTGTVLVSVDPDWEPRYLLPVLQRASPGGAAAYLRLSEDRFVRVAQGSNSVVSEAEVRRAAAGATLLVVQGVPADLPGWLAGVVRRRPGLLYFARGAGAVPGTGLEVLQPLTGEWYASERTPPGPVSRYLTGTDAADLPPLGRLFGSTGASSGPALTARRDRRGGERPIIVLGEAGSRRWAVVQGEGTWRWAARGAGGLNLYRGIYAGVASWLLERADPVAVDFEQSPAEGEPLTWRIAGEVRDLALRVTDSAGLVLWSDSVPAPPSKLSGPVLPAGGAVLQASGVNPEGRFREMRPFHVGPPREMVPGLIGEPLAVSPAAVDGRPPVRGSGRPTVWPFPLAMLLLCVEWVWRRRIGLR